MTIRDMPSTHPGGHDTEAMTDDDQKQTAHAIPAARQALGRQLAALRRTAGYSQKEFAPLTGYGRGTVANVETGRQNVPRAFWERCSQALGADVLVAAYDQLKAMVITEREEAARDAQAARDAEVRAWQLAHQLYSAERAFEFVPLPSRRQADEIHIWLSSSGGGIAYHLIIPRAGATVSKLSAVLGQLLQSTGGEAES
jgi:transcriptional regulator with XRE-family HTH domain